MKRKQLSGAEKRKLGADKKARENAALANVPKINQLFSAIPSASSAIVNQTEIIVDETPRNDCEIDLHTTHNSDDETDTCEFDADIVNISASISHGGAECVNESIEFPTDAALWDITTNILLLQNYWINKGRYDK